MIKALIFDMDGLMFDTESAYSIVQEKMSQKRGKQFNLEVKSTLMGKRALEVMQLLNDWWGKEEHLEDLLKEQDEELTKLYQTSVKKLEGLDDLLLFLNTNNIRKCIGTSSRRFLVDILLKRYGLEGEFEFIISGDMVEKGKPDPEIYNKCLEQLGLKGESCLVLEDSLNGVKAGVAAGCDTCAIPSEYTRHEDFSLANLIGTSLADPALKAYISR